MQQFLMLKLHGAMQSWGTHTYEDYRPTSIFPTRSGVVGLLGACLGIDRDDIEARNYLNASFMLTVRTDSRDYSLQRITDYHTVREARKVDGAARKDAILSNREYLCDAGFTVALSFFENARYGMDKIKQAVSTPHFTPFLGRRSCPLHRPLFEAVIEAEDVLDALQMIEPKQGIIYSEAKLPGSSSMRMRDVPMPTKARQFATRDVYILSEENYHVSQ